MHCFNECGGNVINDPGERITKNANGMIIFAHKSFSGDGEMRDIFLFFIYVTFESRLVELLEFIKNPDISLISLGGHQQL